MYATIILSQAPYGVRQTAVIPTAAGARVFHRVGFGRGLSATWLEEWPAEAQSELVFNQPMSVLMTAAHVRDSSITGRTPNNVLQALGKRVTLSGLTPTVNVLADVYAEVLNLAQTAPAQLSQYAGKTTPVITVQTQAPAPVVQPVVEPEPVALEPAMVVSSPAEPVPASVMHSPTARDLNVLSVPEKFPYYERVFEDVAESKIYDVARQSQQAVLLTGDAGTGKTSSARNYAAKNQLPFVVIECTQQIDNSVVQGRFVPAEDGQSAKWVYSQLATAIQRPSVVLFNELTRMNPKSASLFLRLLAERELFIEPFNEVIKVHPDCLFIADANVGVGYNGTSRQDGALVDRFNLKLNFSYDVRLEEQFLPYPALLQFADGIRRASDLGEEDFTVPMSTRLLQNFVSHASQFNWNFAVARLLSNFPADNGERDAIKMRLDSDAPRIIRDLGLPAETSSDVQ
jgi:hypothetical protein